MREASLNFSNAFFNYAPEIRTISFMVQSAGTVTLDEQQPPRSKDGGNMVSNNLENRIECIDIIPSVKTDNLHHGAATSDFALTEAELGMKRPMTTCLDTFERNNTKSTIFEWNLSDDPPVQRSEALMCSALLDHEDSVDAFHASYSDGYLQGELDSYEPIEAIRDDFMEVEEDYNEFEEGESPSNHYLLNREALMASGPASVTKSRVVVFELLKNEKWLEIGMGICEYLRVIFQMSSM